MAIKKPLPGTSYADLRKKNPPKRTERKALNITERDIAGDRQVDADDQARPSLQIVPSPGSETSEPTKVSSDPAPEAADETPAQVSEEDSSDAKPVERQNVVGDEKTQAPIVDPSLDCQDTPRKPDSKTTAGKDQIGVRGSIPVPSKGAFDLFDRASQHYGELAALKALLDEALKTPGKKSSKNDPIEYPNTGKKLRAYRTVPAADYEEYRKAVDPLGIMPSFKVGSLFLQGILRRYYSIQASKGA